MIEYTSNDISNFAKVLNLLGEEIRLSIILLLRENNLSVNSIANALNISQPLVSHHLRLLKDGDIITSKKDGKQIIYSLKNTTIIDIVDNYFLKRR